MIIEVDNIQKNRVYYGKIGIIMKDHISPYITIAEAGRRRGLSRQAAHKRYKALSEDYVKKNQELLESLPFSKTSDLIYDISAYLGEDTPLSLPFFREWGWHIAKSRYLYGFDTGKDALGRFLDKRFMNNVKSKGLPLVLEPPIKTGEITLDYAAVMLGEKTGEIIAVGGNSAVYCIKNFSLLYNMNLYRVKGKICIKHMLDMMQRNHCRLLPEHEVWEYIKKDKFLSREKIVREGDRYEYEDCR